MSFPTRASSQREKLAGVSALAVRVNFSERSARANASRASQISSSLMA